MPPKNHPPKLSGNAIRQSFIDFFVEKADHTFIKSAPLVPGGDATLLFTNAGMVQFKDVFLGTDKRGYVRAVNSQKCMRVAGKHNDLDDVGRDDTHHTFFEMMGNWSFGNYYKKEAIQWAWELLTEVWGLPKECLYATVFEDEHGQIPTDEEAAKYWKQQPGMTPERVFHLGRAENFWEMADTGPCGPCSEVHIDLRPEDGPVSVEDLDTDRFLELWNLVFIQYNRLGPNELKPLPATHVDTGLGLERVVAVLQNKNSNYRTDLLFPLIETTQKLTGHSDAERDADFTPYRVIADHARAATFLIADGVVPGNLGRNYVCRMIIRRAHRFGGMLDLHEPFLAKVAQTVIEHYGEAYPELKRNRETILATITREEKQFQRSLNRATEYTITLLDELEAQNQTSLPGQQAADLYTTYGMPIEITRDIARERNLDVDQAGFEQAMQEHRLASGAGEAMGDLGGEDVEKYQTILIKLQSQRKLGPEGVIHDPYGKLSFQGKILALMLDGQPTVGVGSGDRVEILLPETHFYIESGGQVSDTGTISSRALTPTLSQRERESLPSPPGRGAGGEGSESKSWEIRVTGIRKPAAGIIIHSGEVISGSPKVGDQATARIDAQRRKDIARNHTATHLLHHALDKVLGAHARQAGSLVAPDRLRFDFTHPDAVTPEQLEEIEAIVNQKILADHDLHIAHKPIQQAINEGARALFGEKYGEIVRNITIGDDDGKTAFSNELCGGTHCQSSGEIGTFIITSEGSAAAGIRRIEAVTGREAYKLIHHRFRVLNQVAAALSSSPDQLLEKAENAINNLEQARKKIETMRQRLTSVDFDRVMDDVADIGGVSVITAVLEEANADTLRQMADHFRQQYPQNGVAVLASVVNHKPILIAAVSNNLVKRGLKAGDLAKFVAKPLQGGGGGRPTLAQAGGQDATKLNEALDSVAGWVEEKLQI
ncbi:MAG: alanine--tRNA ligase [Chloroflexota bacterium]|nr:alanine--tRNA ligase [Chloroflexota bacterium]